MSKAYVCIIGTALGIPTILMCTLSQGENQFYIAIIGLALEYLTAECWIGPAITMVINTISPANKGFAVSAFLFFATIAGMISTTTLGALQDHYEAKTNPQYYGWILACFVVIPYAISLPFFYFAGRTYTEFKIAEKQAKEEEEQRESN